MRGHPLLPRAAKVGKNAPGGFPPAPRVLADFLFMKIGGNANTSTSVYKIGAAAPGIMAVINLLKTIRGLSVRPDKDVF